MRDLRQLYLGKKPYVKPARPHFHLKKYLIYRDLPPIPAVIDWTAKVTNLGMMLNAQIGDCAIAGPGHEIQVMTANAGKQIILPDSAILAAYEAVGGYQPDDPNNPQSNATDNGCYLNQVMAYWQKTGIGGHKIGAYVQVDLEDQGELAAGLFLFGGLVIGVALPLTARTQFQNNQPWTVQGDPNTSDPNDPAAPGSWGGHCVVWPKKANPCGLITWGEVYPADLAWILAYMDEAWAVVSQDWIEDNGKAPSGLDIQTLTSDLAVVQQPAEN